MVLGIASLSFMDALGKRVAAHYSVFQMLAIRSTVALALIVGFLAATRQLGALRTRQPKGHALRALCGFSTAEIARGLEIWNASVDEAVGAASGGGLR